MFTPHVPSKMVSPDALPYMKMMVSGIAFTPQSISPGALTQTPFMSKNLTERETSQTRNELSVQ